ncbi:MAG: MBL fold metallo-hydrolase [bacterium]
MLLGTGCPNVDPHRMGPAQLVCHEGATILVDCGSGVTQRMVAAGFDGKNLDAVLLTHLHSDHVVDLFQLVSTSWQRGRDKPMRVIGPQGTARFVEDLMALWRSELELRIAHEKRPSADALRVEVEEIGAGEVFVGAGDGGGGTDGLRVEAVEVDHRPVQPAFGFVCRAGGRTLALSGDTTYCPALIKAAGGADLLVHEVLSHREFTPRPGVSTAEGIAGVTSYHTRSDVVGKVAAEAGVKALVLSHFVPTRIDKAAMLAEVRRDFAGLLILGEDLMRIDLHSGVLTYAGAHIALTDWGSG